MNAVLPVLEEMTLGELLSIIAVEKLVCPRCEAKPLNSCVTLNGKKTKTHVPRWSPLLEAYIQGAAGAVYDVLPPFVLDTVHQMGAPN